MLMVARKMQSMMLMLAVLGFALLLYPLSLKVAAKRTELARTERAIADAHARIRYLESEFAVRSAMHQLHRWNAESFGYGAPDAVQYLAGERQLASLDTLPRAHGVQPVAPVLAMTSPVAPTPVQADLSDDDAPVQAAPASDVAPPRTAAATVVKAAHAPVAPARAKPLPIVKAGLADATPVAAKPTKLGLVSPAPAKPAKVADAAKKAPAASPAKTTLAKADPTKRAPAAKKADVKKSDPKKAEAKKALASAKPVRDGLLSAEARRAVDAGAAREAARGTR